MSDERVKFNFDITFTSGGGLQGQDFRLDIAGNDISDEELAAYLIRDLRLLMVGEDRIRNKEILTEPHKRTPPAPEELSAELVDLRDGSTSCEALFARASNTTLRVIGPDGDSYLVRRAAQQALLHSAVHLRGWHYPHSLRKLTWFALGGRRFPTTASLPSFRHDETHCAT